MHASRVASQTKRHPFVSRQTEAKIGMRSESESKELALPWWESPSEKSGGEAPSTDPEPTQNGERFE